MTGRSPDSAPGPLPRRHRPALGLALVTLVVPDYDEALAFYAGVLGFDVLEDTELRPGKRWVVVAPAGGGSGAALLLAQADGDRQRARVGDQTGGRVALFLVTDDVRREHHRLVRAGVTFEQAPREEPYGTVAVFSDRYGNRWDLLQPADGSQPVPGAT